MLDFLKFKVLVASASHHQGHTVETLLINRDHVVSIKPIQMVLGDDVTQVFWIRTANNKKYKAIEIPQELERHFDDEDLTNDGPVHDFTPVEVQ